MKYREKNTAPGEVAKSAMAAQSKGGTRPGEKAPQHENGQGSEQGGGASDRDIGKAEDRHQRKSEIVEGWAVIVAGVVGEDTLAYEPGEEETVDAFVVMEGTHAQVLKTQGHGQSQNGEGDGVGLREALHRTRHRR